MKLESLRVYHLPKGRDSHHLWPSAFYLQTCQRQVWVSHTSARSEIAEAAEIYHGREAYRFLLRWATGLKSEVLGETDIFGQIKEAWRKAEATRNSAIMELSPWIQRLFEDTKEIRSQYLQNLGGSSYGTLIRKWLKGRSPGPLLLIGAGQIAQSIAPVLLDSELWLWNRNPIHLCAFFESLQCRSSHAHLKKLETLEAELEAWQKAAHVIVCVPLHPERDAERVKCFQKGDSGSDRTVIHLGARKQDSGLWSGIPSFASLDDLFALQGSLDHVRSVQFARAERACEERAKLRAMGASLSIPHGWEDLACFA